MKKLILLSFVVFVCADLVSAQPRELLHSSTSLSLPRGYLAATSVGDLALFAGGYTGHNAVRHSRVDIYNAATGEWSTAELSVPRISPAAASVGNLALFGGGSDNQGRSSVVDIYNAATGQWSTAALSQARTQLAATAVGTKVLFAGGMDSDVVDIYDASTDAWSVAALSVPRDALSAVSVGNKAFFAGGRKSDVVDIYDAENNTWSTHTLSQPRAWLSAVTVGSKVLFAGGEKPYSVAPVGDYSDVVDIYDISTDTWTVTQLPHQRKALSAGVLGDLAIFAGGYGPTSWGQDYQQWVEVYDTSSGRWDTWSAGDLTRERMVMAAATAGDKLLFAGGAGSGGYVDTVDIYTIPEPATLSVFALGGLALVRRRKRGIAGNLKRERIGP